MLTPDYAMVFADLRFSLSYAVGLRGTKAAIAGSDCLELPTR